MKKKYLAAFALIIMVLAFSSCATSKKYGCPTVSVDSKKFKV
jgi:predicted S18 family serine protease